MITEYRERRKRKLLICGITVCMMAAALIPADAYASKSKGRYPTRAGVILVTPDWYKGLIPTGHAAIVQNKDYVIEAVADGVGRHDNNWKETKSRVYGVTVKKTTSAQDRRAYKYCEAQIGKKYNWNYYNVKTRKRFYCSHLVWAAFLDKNGIDLNTKAFGVAVHPLELVNTRKTKVIYRFSRR